jgi:3-oxoacyl-[acyl-carrier-protein] synthase III
MSPSRTSRIAGTGSFLPPTVNTNRDLYELESIRRAFDVERARGSLRDLPDAVELEPVEVFDQWARQVTGIRERRVVAPGDGLTTEVMCAIAAERALERAGLDPQELDLILVASVSPADNVPNAACTVGQRLGVPHVGGFTLNGACTGFVHAMGAAHAFIQGGAADTVLAVAGDTLTRITDFGDPTTAVLFSDGASAAVLTASDTPGILGPPFLGADYAREHLFIVGQGWETPDEPEPKLRMGGGPRVLRRAILAMEDAADRALERAGVGWDSLDLVVPHQANLRITRGLESHLKLEGGRVVHTIEHYGNCSAATVGIALDEALSGLHGPLPDPVRVVLTAVGGGYTTAALVADLSPYP